MKKKFLFKILLFLSFKVFSQNTDIRPTSINYPILNTNAILALTPSDGLRAGTTVYNSELQTLVIYDGCDWSILNKSYVNDQNPVQELICPTPQNNSRFGSALEANGKLLVVGASHMDIGGNVDMGAAYLYRKAGCFWILLTQLPNIGGAAGEHFGKSVDIGIAAGSIQNRLIVAVAGDQHVNTYFVDLDAGGNPDGYYTDQTLVNTNTRPVLYVKLSRLQIADELTVTYGLEFTPRYISVNTSSECSGLNPLGNSISIFTKVSPGAFSLYSTTPTNFILSAGVVIPASSVGRKLIYAEVSCDYFSIQTVSNAPRVNIVRFDPTIAPSPGYIYIPTIPTLPNESIIPTLDLEYNGRYSQLAIGDLYGRNKQIKILSISKKGLVDKEETIVESNVYECVSTSPSACIQGTIQDADSFGRSLSISGDMLIVGAYGTALDANGISPFSGAVYIYKRTGNWGLEKLIRGQAVEGIGYAVASTSKNYFYSSVIKNSGQGSVYIGEW